MLEVGGKKHRLHHPHTISQPVRHYLMPVLTGVAIVAEWEYFVWFHLPLSACKPLMTSSVSTANVVQKTQI